MHKNVIQIPEIDGWQFLGKNALHLSIDQLTRVWINFAARLIDQGVHFLIRIRAAVGAVGRELRRVKGVFEDVGIFVASNPAQPIKLKSAMSYVGEKRCELEAANVEHDPHLTQLLL